MSDVNTRMRVYWKMLLGGCGYYIAICDPRFNKVIEDIKEKGIFDVDSLSIMYDGWFDDMGVPGGWTLFNEKQSIDLRIPDTYHVPRIPNFQLGDSRRCLLPDAYVLGFDTIIRSERMPTHQECFDRLIGVAGIIWERLRAIQD